jgi:hypothetical protein
VTTTKLPLADRDFETPTRVVVEASWQTIHDLDLNEWQGEHFSSIDAVIRIEVSRETVALETVRTLAAWQRGEPSAGRGRWEFPRSAIAAIHA